MKTRIRFPILLGIVCLVLNYFYLRYLADSLSKQIGYTFVVFVLPMVIFVSLLCLKERKGVLQYSKGNVGAIFFGILTMYIPLLLLFFSIDS